MRSKEVCFQLEAFANNLDSALDGGARPVAYRCCEESGEMVLVLWHEDGSEERLYPSVLDEFQAWLRTLPNKEPEEDEDEDGALQPIRYGAHSVFRP